MPTEQILRIYAEPLRVERDSQEIIEETFLGRVIEAVFKENAWLELLQEAARLYQIFGGCYFKVVHDVSYVNGVRIEQVPANCVFPIFDNQRQIVEVWVVYWIGQREAAIFGYKTESDRAIYVEHWTKDKWEVRIGNEGLSDFQIAKDANGQPMENANPYIFPNGVSVIPFFYVPRFRAGTNYGIPLTEDIIGLGLELNESGADIGDAIAENARRIPWTRDSAWRS